MSDHRRMISPEPPTLVAFVAELRRQIALLEEREPTSGELTLMRRDLDDLKRLIAGVGAQ